MAASAALAAWLAWRSLGWPLIHDAPLMHYIAWIIARGGVPYRDVFDMNLPGVYLIHGAVIAVLGRGDLAWRVFDLAWLAATMAVLWAFVRPLGAVPAAGGAILFALYHLSGGAWRAGQRDFLLCLFLLAGALGVARSLERGGAVAPLAWAGLVLGAGIMVKPHAGLFWLGSAALAGWGAWRAGRGWLIAPATVIGAGLVVPAIVFGWLAWRGGLGSFVVVLTGYVLPLYGHVGRVAIWRPFLWFEFGLALWSVLAALAVLGVFSPAPGMEARKMVAGLGAVSGAVHFVAQGKGWEYQLYPLAVFLCVLAAFSLQRFTEAARAYGHPTMTPSAPGLRRAVAAACFVAVVAVMGLKGAGAIEPRWIADKAHVVASLTRALGPLVPADKSVQVFDVTEGGIHALWNLGLTQPTRFLYDFHFFHDTGDPRIQAMRREMTAGLAAHPPAAIVILRDTWNRKGYDRFDDWPDVARLLARDYRLAIENAGDGYRIYVQRART